MRLPACSLSPFQRLCSGLLLSLAFLVVPNRAVGQALQAQGTWSSSDGQLAGTWQATFDAAGKDIGGTIAIAGMPGLTQGNIVGSMGTGTIDFGVLYNNWQAAAFDGTVTATTLTGTFSTPDAVAGSWQGSFGASSATPVPATPSGP